MCSIPISSFTRRERNKRAHQRAEESGPGCRRPVTRRNWNWRFLQWEGRWPEAKSGKAWEAAPGTVRGQGGLPSAVGFPRSSARLLPGLGAGHQAEAGPPVWTRNHEGLREGGRRERERPGPRSEKPQRAAASRALVNRPNLCFLAGGVSRPEAFCLLRAPDAARSLHRPARRNDHLLGRASEICLTQPRRPWGAGLFPKETPSLEGHGVGLTPFTRGWKGQGAREQRVVSGCS